VTQWRGKVTKQLRCVIVPVFAVTLLNSLVSHWILFTDALLYIKDLVHFHLMAQYRYHTKATIDDMENYLKEFHRHKDAFRRFRASQSTQNVLESFQMQLTLGDL
jgi:hypothetical protein